MKLVNQISKKKISENFSKFQNFHKSLKNFYSLSSWPSASPVLALPAMVDTPPRKSRSRATKPQPWRLLPTRAMLPPRSRPPPTDTPPSQNWRRLPSPSSDSTWTTTTTEPSTSTTFPEMVPPSPRKVTSRASPEIWKDQFPSWAEPTASSETMVSPTRSPGPLMVKNYDPSLTLYRVLSWVI